MKKRGGRRKMTTAIIGENKVLSFKKPKRKVIVNKSLTDFYSHIKPFHKESLEYQLSSVEAAYDDEDDDD